ncbi:MAG: metal-dependent transcriptional regulator [Planctomycetota bacterium]|jgi:DtxR family Mn-dependent transcriptional regulator|nr:metal-dependent transcriptional regulator [Planctomycetota bacterium]
MRKKIGLTAALEDYLEAIHNLTRNGQAAHSNDIAKALEVHKSTVSAALRSLGGMRLIRYTPYKAVTLTPDGRKLAEDVVRRHQALLGFFVDVLRIDPAMAETAACGMEHAIPREIVDRLAGFADAVLACPRRAAALSLPSLAGCAAPAVSAAAGPGTPATTS